VAQGEAPYTRRPSLHAMWREAEVACLPLRESEHAQIANAARSLMAEAVVNRHGRGKFCAVSVASSSHRRMLIGIAVSVI
jgi:hypothetical protein